MVLIEKYIQNCQAYFGLSECEGLKYPQWTGYFGDMSLTIASNRKYSKEKNVLHNSTYEFLQVPFKKFVNVISIP